MSSVNNKSYSHDRLLYVYIKVLIPDTDRSVSNQSNDGRDVWLYDGDVDLDDYEFEIMTFEKSERQSNGLLPEEDPLQELARALGRVRVSPGLPRGFIGDAVFAMLGQPDSSIGESLFRT